jgi:DNA-binding XRE family transcriptional regulator
VTQNTPKTVHERLAMARAAAGYPTAGDAADALGVSRPGYVHHENGTRGLSRAASRYAKFFRVSIDWLIDGKGDMKARRRQGLPYLGVVGAGASVAHFNDASYADAIDYIDLPEPEDTFVLKVKGDSAVRGSFVLESQNAPTEDAPLIIAAYRVRGALTD